MQMRNRPYIIFANQKTGVIRMDKRNKNGDYRNWNIPEAFTS